MTWREVSCQCLTFNIPEDKWEELGLSGIIELDW